MAPPKTRYAKNGDVRIAYQVVGEGALDLVVVPGLVSHLDLTWEEPSHAWFCGELAKFSRLILFDKRGTGLSDRDAGVPDLQERMDDVRAVLDAAGARRPAMLSVSEGGMMSLLFAATYPERLRALVVYGGFAQSPTRDWPPDQAEARFDVIERAWGAGAVPPRAAPSMAADQDFRRAWLRFERESASPEVAAALLRMDHNIDVSSALPAIHVPTLLLHRRDDRRIGVEHARYVAERMPDAAYVELPGEDHLPYIGDSARVVAEIEKFLSTLPDTATPDSALATVMALGTEMTDRADALGAIVGREIARWHGRELSIPGNGWLAAFDGPARAVRCAQMIGVEAQALGIATKAGLHTGEIATSGDATGETVELAMSIAGSADPNEIVASSAVRYLIAGSGLRFKDRDSPALPSLGETLQLYAVG